MRFIKSQTSFKSGRLSPKLNNRIDTAQYKDGASVMQGFRPISEGGAEATTGKRWINEGAYNPVVGFNDSKMISFSIGGNQLTAVLVGDQFGNTDVYLYKYPYVYGTETSIYLGQNTAWVPELFDFCVSKNHLILTHFSGKFQPKYLEFNPDNGNFVDMYTLQFQETIGPTTYNRIRGYQPAYSEFQGDTISIGNPNYTTNTVDLTSSDPDVVNLLQSKEFFYAEALGHHRNDGDKRVYNYVASNFYTWVQDISNGVRVNFEYFHHDQIQTGVDTSAGFDDPIFQDVQLERLLFANVSEFDIWAYNLWDTDDWPRTVTNFEGRVVFGGNASQPLSLVGSKVGDIKDFKRIKLAETGSDIYTNGKFGEDSVPTDPYLFTISADDDSEITSLRTANELFIGTDRREYIATGGDTILSKLSVQIKPYTAQGCYPVSAKTMGNLVVYLDQSRKKIFQFKYNDANGSFLSDDLTTLFNDLVEGDRIQQLEWAPHIKTLFVLMESEKLHGIVWDPSAEVQAFYETLQTGVTAMSYVAAREENSGQSHHRGDHLLMFVRGKGLMSYEQTFFETGVQDSYVKEERTDANEYMYLEDVYEIKRSSANNYSVNGEAVVTGSDGFPLFSAGKSPVFTVPFRAMNLDTGEVVTITNLTSDGANPWLLANDPAIDGASKILVGNLPEAKTLATMPIEAGQQYGPAQLAIKNIDEVGIRFYKSYSYDISPDGENWQEVRVADKAGNARTGRKETKFRGNPDYDFRVWIRQDKPEPLTITGINMRGVSNDG